MIRVVAVSAVLTMLFFLARPHFPLATVGRAQLHVHFESSEIAVLELPDHWKAHYNVDRHRQCAVVKDATASPRFFVCAHRYAPSGSGARTEQELAKQAAELHLHAGETVSSEVRQMTSGPVYRVKKTFRTSATYGVVASGTAVEERFFRRVGGDFFELLFDEDATQEATLDPILWGVVDHATIAASPREVGGTVLFILFPIGAIALWLVANVMMFRRYHAAANAGSAARMRRWGNWIVRVNAPPMRVIVDVDILIVEERYEEALRRLDDLPSTAPANVILTGDHNRAWCLLQSGQAEAALALAERVCASPLPVDAAKRANRESTRAIALLLTGRAAEALPLLEKAVEAPVQVERSRAIRWYYLGEARRALDRPDAAIAYQRACEFDPHGPWAKRAQARLENSNAYR